MRSARILREGADRSRIRHIEAVDADLCTPRRLDLGRNAAQTGLVAIGQREIASTRRKLDCERTPDTAARACDRRSRSANCCHRYSCLETMQLFVHRMAFLQVPCTFLNWNRTIQRFRF